MGDYTLKIVTGTDTMTGCLDLNHNRKCDKHGPRGTISMSYQRVATFDKSGTVFLESYCSHPVTGVENDGHFKQFTKGGLILMTDRSRDGHGGDIRSTYRGTVTVS